MSSFDSFKIQMLNLFKGPSRSTKGVLTSSFPCSRSLIENIPEDLEIETYRTTKFDEETEKSWFPEGKPSFPGAHVQVPSECREGNPSYHDPNLRNPSNKAGANPFGAHSCRRTGGFVGKVLKIEKGSKNISKHVMYSKCTHVLFYGSTSSFRYFAMLGPLVVSSIILMFMDRMLYQFALILCFCCKSIDRQLHAILCACKLLAAL